MDVRKLERHLIIIKIYRLQISVKHLESVCVCGGGGGALDPPLTGSRVLWDLTASLVNMRQIQVGLALI